MAKKRAENAVAAESTLALTLIQSCILCCEAEELVYTHLLRTFST